MRSSVVEGAINGIYESLSRISMNRRQLAEITNCILAHFFRNPTASSGGRSTTMKPLAPEVAAS